MIKNLQKSIDGFSVEFNFIVITRYKYKASKWRLASNQECNTMIYI